MTDYYVQIIKYGTDKVIEAFGPFNREREAEKVDGGININLNHEEFYTVISEFHGDSNGSH